MACARHTLHQAKDAVFEREGILPVAQSTHGLPSFPECTTTHFLCVLFMSHLDAVKSTTLYLRIYVRVPQHRFLGLSGTDDELSQLWIIAPLVGRKRRIEIHRSSEFVHDS